MTTIADLLGTTSSNPEWTCDNDIVIELDRGENSKGTFGYECHRIERGTAVIGYVYDDGAGYQWAEGESNVPHELTADERGTSGRDA